MMKTYSPNNDTNFPKIDRIIEDIIKSEDRVKELTINSSKILETNEAILKDLNHDINHNCNRINLLKEFIQSEETQTEKEIKKREDEKKNIDNLIKDLEDEIFKFEIFSKKIFQESSTISTKLELERIFSSDVSNEIRENKLELNKLTDKKTRILKNLDEYTNSVNEISETLIMLREEKETVEIEIVNLISHKESLEELIQFNNFSLFKNIPLNSSLETINTSINLTRVIEIHPHEISAITNFNKFSRILFENLANFIQTEIKSKKDSIFVGQAQNFSEISIDFTKFDKSHFDALIKKYLTTYKESKDLYNVDDFFILLTKKIYDFLIQSVEKNYMFVIKEINLERLRFYFKYFFKIHRYENVIASKINFVNREFKILKKEKIGKIDELEKRIASLKFSWDKLQSREAQLKEKISSYDNNTDNNKNKFPQVQEAEFKLKTLRSLDEKMNALIELKNQLNCDIFNLNSEHRKNIRDYEEKIKQFEMINEELNKKHSHILKENDNLKIQTNEETLKIRNSISEKYKQLKELIKFENEQGNYADFLDNIQKYLNEKNRMYNFPRNIFSDDEIKTSRISSNTRDIMNIKSANSHVGTSRNQTLTSIKNQSEIQSVNSYMNVNNPNTRLDFIKTLDYSKFRDKPSISPIKSINTHSNFSHKKFSDRPHNLYQNNSEYTDSIISIEESNSNNQIKQQNYSFAKLNYINIDNKNNENSSISNFKSNTRKHKSRSIDSKPRIITQKMIDEKTIKKHVEALKSKINNECFGMIGDIEKNKKVTI